MNDRPDRWHGPNPEMEYNRQSIQRFFDTQDERPDKVITFMKPHLESYSYWHGGWIVFDYDALMQSGGWEYQVLEHELGERVMKHIMAADIATEYRSVKKRILEKYGVDRVEDLPSGDQ